mmetsp:Transcript_32736/g.82473  ORF Transcript_32736/g.82473 Transcript_32736/m.82473 type:complete len:343 (-) Transcript_32736:586-1614(-)
MSKESSRMAPPLGMRGGYGPPPGFDHPADLRRYEQHLAEKYFLMQQQHRGGAPPPFPPGFLGPPPEFSMAMLGPPPGMPMVLPPGMPPPGYPYPPYPPGAYPPGYFGPNAPPPPCMGPHGSPSQRSPGSRAAPHVGSTPPGMEYMPEGQQHRNSRIPLIHEEGGAPENARGNHSYPGSPPRCSSSPKRRPDSPARNTDATRHAEVFRRTASQDHLPPGIKRERSRDVSPSGLGAVHSEQGRYADLYDDGYDHDRLDPENSTDDREAKRLRRKQSNRESARRSRLRKQAECEELGGRIHHLQQVNQQLRMEFMSVCGIRDELQMRRHLMETQLSRRRELGGKA